MGKKLTIIIGDCFDCPYLNECSGDRPDMCIHEDSPGGEDRTPIPDVRNIPDWCPLEEA